MTSYKKRGRSKFSGVPENPQNVAKQVRDLDNIRDALTDQLLEYRGFLGDRTLNSNKTEMEKKAMNDVLSKIQDLSMKLETMNVGEGTMTLSIAALRSILIIHNDVNNLTWRVYSLYDKLDSIQKSLDVLISPDSNTEEESKEDE